VNEDQQNLEKLKNDPNVDVSLLERKTSINVEDFKVLAAKQTSI
jgi:hypothetical protein